MIQETPKTFKWFAYVTAWVAYCGAFLTKASNISSVVRDSFADIHIPKKDEYF